MALQQRKAVVVVVVVTARGRAQAPPQWRGWCAPRPTMAPLLMHTMWRALESAGQQRQQREAALPLVAWLSPIWCARPQLGSKPPAFTGEQRAAGKIDTLRKEMLVAHSELPEGRHIYTATRVS